MSEHRELLAAAIAKAASHKTLVEGFDSRIARAQMVSAEVASELTKIDENIATARHIKAEAMRLSIEEDDPCHVLQTDDLLPDLLTERSRVLEHQLATSEVLKFLEDNREVEKRIGRGLNDQARLAMFAVVGEEAQAMVDELTALNFRAEILRARLKGFLETSTFVFDSEGARVSVPVPSGLDEALNPIPKLYEGHLAPSRLSAAAWNTFKNDLMENPEALYSEPATVPVLYVGPAILAGGPKPSLEGPRPPDL